MDDPLRILIVKFDRLSADTLARAAKSLFGHAHVQSTYRLADANAALSAEVFDLLVCGVVLPDGDMLDLLAAVTAEPRRAKRVLVVTLRRESHILESLRLLRIDGLFDSAAEGLTELEFALRSVVAGCPYWSPTMRTLFQECLTPTAICRLLTLQEQIVFSVLGEGCDDDVGAEILGLKFSTVHSARREIHRKLHIQHRGELVRLAVQHGFVHFSATATIRPAFATLLAASASKKIKYAARPVTLDLPSANCALL